MQNFLDTVFINARSHTHWENREVPHALLEEIHKISILGPTSANALPLRTFFIKTPEAKEKLKDCLMEGNIEKTMAAPVTALFAYDLEFYKHFPRLFPHADAASWFTGNAQLIQDTAFRNSTLQIAYFMLAARAYGLDCGPMSGFDTDKINTCFLGGTTYKVNMLCNLGYGNPETLFPRLPRFDFKDVCQVI